MHFKIEGLHPALDGDYPFDVETLNNRDLHTIKEISGVRAAELEESFKAGDNDLTVAFCGIALQKAGKTFSWDAIWNAKFGMIQFVVDDEAEDPLAEAPETPADKSESKPTSGDSSAHDSGQNQNGQSFTGIPDSGTGSDSDLVTSAT